MCLYTHTYIFTICSEVVNPLTPTKYTVLNGNFVFDSRNFDLHDVFQECNPDMKRDLPLFSFVVYTYEIHKRMSVTGCEVYGQGSETGKSYFTFIMYSECDVL